MDKQTAPRGDGESCIGEEARGGEVSRNTSGDQAGKSEAEYGGRRRKIEKKKLIDLVSQPTSGFTTTGDAPIPSYTTDKDTKLISLLQINEEEIAKSEARMREIEEEKVRKANDSLFDASKKKFGVTNDIREAGYVLPDGAMLDFCFFSCPCPKSCG